MYLFIYLGRIPLDVAEKHFHTHAKSTSPSGVSYSSVLRAFPPAPWKKHTITAVGWNVTRLEKTKTLLHLGIGHFSPMRILDIADFVLGRDEVITGVDIAIVLDDHPLSAR